MKAKTWNELDAVTQKEEYEKQMLAWKFREKKKEWANNYISLARALANEFGEETVLDILEQTWWNLEFEGGKTWREESEKDPVAALKALYQANHHGLQSLTISPQDAVFEGRCYGLIHYFCHLKEVFLNRNERKIGISWCMADAAAVRGFHPHAVLDFRNSQIRGESFCYHIRKIVDHADPGEDQWSKDKSEQIGWRSIQRLEEDPAEKPPLATTERRPPEDSFLINHLEGGAPSSPRGTGSFSVESPMSDNMIMQHQTATFHPLPSKEKILKRIAIQERRISFPVSYLLYIMPVADRFGDRVYDVAVRSLGASGVEATSAQLRKLAAELKTPAGQKRYWTEKWQHIWSITPVRVPVIDW